jgi:2-amino-4-hydroxy-6-hydroxymethyldihydropteridine diphosphokinase
MILIGLGANLASAEFGAPPASLEAALRMLQESGVRIVARSRWYRSAPVPASSQPWFVNGVAAVETTLDPVALLALLHEIEARFGRVRRERNAARVLDLDLLDYAARVRAPALGRSGAALATSAIGGRCADASGGSPARADRGAHGLSVGAITGCGGGRASIY